MSLLWYKEQKEEKKVMSNSEYVLEARKLSKSFPGVKALDQVSLKVRPGTVHALMGENGAGKSTLMKCIYGIYAPDEGTIHIDGQQVSIASPRNAMDQGIAMIHQEIFFWEESLIKKQRGYIGSIKKN